jgi:hypothetical protein
MRVDLIFVEGGKALAGRARRSGRQRSASRGDDQRKPLQGRSIPVLHRFLLFDPAAKQVAGRV